jgi:antitoxin component YwqK of YwqJK toxin-antitoxin module
MRIITIILVLIAATACESDQKPDTQTINKHILSGDFEMYEHLSSCNCDSLTIDSTDTYYKNDSLYTGVCYTIFPESEKKAEIRQLFKGQLHGNRINLSKQGDTLVQSIYNLGELKSRTTSEIQICHCDSLNEINTEETEKLKYYREAPFTGICNRYFPLPDTNIVYLEIPYKNGLVDGEMIIYDRRGKEILTEVYDEGEKVR